MTDYKAKERAAVKALALAWSCRTHHFAEYDPLDFWCERDRKMFAVGEHKYRDHLFGKYPDTWLRLTKWQALEKCHTHLGLTALFVVEFKDGSLYYVDIVDLGCPPCTLAVGGREDRPERGDWDKYQPMVAVPTESLIKVNWKGQE